MVLSPLIEIPGAVVHTTHGISISGCHPIPRSWSGRYSTSVRYVGVGLRSLQRV